MEIGWVKLKETPTAIRIRTGLSLVIRILTVINWGFRNLTDLNSVNRKRNPKATPMHFPILK